MYISYMGIWNFSCTERVGVFDRWSLVVVHSCFQDKSRDRLRCRMKPRKGTLSLILLLLIFTWAVDAFLSLHDASAVTTCPQAIFSLNKLISAPKSSSTTTSPQEHASIEKYDLACHEDCKKFLGDNPLVKAYCDTRRNIEEKASRLNSDRRLTSIESHPCAPMDKWNASRTESFILTNSDNVTAALLQSHGVDGFTLSHITGQELIQMGVKAGRAYQLLRAVSKDKVSIVEHSLPAIDPCSVTYNDADNTGAVTININIDKILSINELDYEFTALMWVFVAYLDDRSDVMPQIFGPCEEPALNMMASQPRVCADDMFIKSDLPFFFTNQKGQYEMVGSQRWMFEFGGNPPGYYVGIHFLQATFNNDLSFVDFPFDRQHLKMVIRALWDEDVGIKLDSFDLDTWTSPGWKVNSISSKYELQEGLDKWKMTPNHFNFAWFQSAMQQGWDYSAQVLTIEVERESDFYTLNMIIPIWLLMILSWSAFFMDPESIDGRMGMVLTIMLGFIAFQFVVNDNMPKSGESSRLHEFMALASVTISFVGFESVIVYKLHENSEAYKIFLHSSGVWNYICVHLHFFDDDEEGDSMDEDGEEHRHVGLVDTLSVLLVPNVFSIRTYVIMGDLMSLYCMAICLVCTISYIVGNFVFERWDHDRKVLKRRKAREENDEDTILYTEGKLM